MRRPAAVEMPEPQRRLFGFQTGDQYEALTHYQSLCEPLIRWRDEMIIQRSESDRDVATQVSEEADRKVQLLLELEARCGNQALTLRTEHVMAAYALSTSSSTRPLQSSQQDITRAETQRNKLLDVLLTTTTASAPRQPTCGEGYRLKMRGGCSNTCASI